MPDVREYWDQLDKLKKTLAAKRAVSTGDPMLNRLEAEAILRKSFEDRGILKPNYPNPIALAADGTNAGMADSPLFRLPENQFHVPKDLNVGGWTNTMTGDSFVASKPGSDDPSQMPLANIAGHEGYHSKAVKFPYKFPQPETDADRRAAFSLEKNMNKIQPPAKRAGPYWGLEPSSSYEEQIANLMGYESNLPAGQAITKSPIADQLFAEGSRASPQEMKDYYFDRSSLPYKGLWEGQAAPPPSATDQALSVILRLLKRQ